MKKYILTIQENLMCLFYIADPISWNKKLRCCYRVAKDFPESTYVNFSSYIMDSHLQIHHNHIMILEANSLLCLFIAEDA